MWTHHQSIGGAHAVEAMVKGSKLLINGPVQQEVDVQLDVLCGKRDRVRVRERRHERESDRGRERDRGTHREGGGVETLLQPGSELVDGKRALMM